VPSMRAMRLALGLLLLLALGAAPAQAADTPTPRTLYEDGPEGRYLMEGDWQFSRARGGPWSTVQVPHAWNVGDHSVRSFIGGVAWYRKDFELPSASAALDWAVRFESVNYRARVWLNGREVGSHAGAYLPFTMLLDRLNRRGVNRLVVRVDSRRTSTDLPPGRLSPRTGLPTGGWWNYGGILREVYLQRLDRLQIESALVTPRLRCTTCDATTVFRARVRNVSSTRRRATLTGTFGDDRVRLGARTLRPGQVRSFRGSLRVADPHLWSPRDPHLYPAAVEARVGGRLVGRWSMRTGVRSVDVQDGRLRLNGQPVQLRGVGLHEDTAAQGFAVDNTFRRWLVDRTKELGATMLRTHYPMHPYIHEIADREGLLIWSEIPVYAHKSSVIDNITPRALAELRHNIETNGSHPSVLIWSIANELSSKPGPTQGTYIRRAKRAARQIDPTRPVGLAVAAYPGAGCQRRYGPLDVVGVNDYFGWYPGPSGSLFDRDRLSDYLDALRRCYPNDAVMITEFGAEANRDGSIEDKGTYAFQQDFVNYHLSVFATKPWLSGALYWAINEFRVRPEWDGGNPWPSSPIHQKALLHYDGTPKPAWTDVQRWFLATPQIP
jgi:beta-glucuronidase